MQLELEQQQSYRLFSSSIRSDETRKTYTLLLKKFIEYLGEGDILLGSDTKWIERNILTKPKDFVIRNRTMALISDATIIVEASNRSNSLHQGWEALKLGRPLFIWKRIVERNDVDWPQDMLQYGAMILDDPKDVLEILPTASPFESLKLLS